MKLSIVMPVFNEEKTVAQVLKKVADVKFKGITIEIIVVDDGSTDKSVKKITATEIPGLKLYVHKKNQGKGAAVRTGTLSDAGIFRRG